MRFEITRSLAAILAAAAMACASAPRPPPAPTSAPAPSPAAVAPRAPSAPETGLLFDVEPAEVQIAVDGRLQGTVAELASRGGVLPLAPGIYQVSLRAPGYATWRAEVAVRAGSEPIRVRLTKNP
ncbi:MAG TPA: PEGA domain-containing protein [Anaeromyxobacteraceae bacterium]|nr:PEGA domain-containing protein [Anaeromyxobacteraceae bacterium]